MNEDAMRELMAATSVSDVRAIAERYGKEPADGQAEELFDTIRTAGSADGAVGDEALSAASGGVSEEIAEKIRSSWDGWHIGGRV